MASLAVGLFAFGIISVVADVGATWSVVRVVAAGDAPAYAAFKQAAIARSLASIVCASAATLLATMMGYDGGAVALGGAVAVASGVSEVGFGTLRCVGKVRTEAAVRVAERLAFAAGAIVVLATSARGTAVLFVYVVTNGVTMSIVAAVLRSTRSAEPAMDRRLLWNGETARTAVAYAVLSLAPRLSAVILLALATESDVATYAVVARPTEAIALLLISLISPALPVLRRAAVSNRDEWARSLTGRLLANIVLVAAPVVTWCVIDANDAVSLLARAGRYPEGATTLALVAAVALSWPVRALFGYSLLAQERGGRYAWTGAIQVAALLILGVPAIQLYGAVGAAAVIVASDIAALVAMAPWRLAALDSRARVLAATGAAVAVLVGTTTAFVSALPSFAIAGFAAAWSLARSARSLELLDAGADEE